MDKNRAKGWLEGRLESRTFRRLFERERVTEYFLGTIESLMQAKGITRSRLAELMECHATPANITRAMRRSTNMTLSTMVDMTHALDCEVRVSVAVGLGMT